MKPLLFAIHTTSLLKYIYTILSVDLVELLGKRTVCRLCVTSSQESIYIS